MYGLDIRGMKIRCQTLAACEHEKIDNSSQLYGYFRCARSSREIYEVQGVEIASIVNILLGKARKGSRRLEYQIKHL